MAEGENRQFPTWMVLLQGLALGLAAFAVAELSLPGGLEAGDHDMMLAQRLGLVYTPLVGAWLGWLQRSRRRALMGALAGTGIGIVYYLLCMSRDFLAIMVGFPALLGGGLAALVGSNRSQGVAAFFGRLARGLVAGLVLGVAYLFLLSFILNTFVNPATLFTGYASHMWKGGLPAMAISSALFFVALRWAIGLVRLRIEHA
jgi:hypothetical protein